MSGSVLLKRWIAWEEEIKASPLAGSRVLVRAFETTSDRLHSTLNIYYSSRVFLSRFSM